ncbi:calcium-binding protein [Neptunicoccus sediminis]|uniref:calcium-binding protein n=1 Tax=Neptunicoccus sediminis TaxID=1892596 RepID=UPI001560C98B|nr:calcium-binding protein [Neptunicoccus sediminis]
MTDKTVGTAAFDLFTDGWSYADRIWSYTPRLFEQTTAGFTVLNDVIGAGGGGDVVRGKGGDDLLFGNAGRDSVDAGTGDDIVFGGMGRDRLFLGDGADVAAGGNGNDRINSGAGDDLVYGDGSGQNLLATSVTDTLASDLAAYGSGGNWDVTHDSQGARMSQSFATENGASYQISFDLAANLNASSEVGGIAVFWNGQRVGRFDAGDGVYTTYSIDVRGDGKMGTLSFKEIGFATGDRPEVRTDGPIFLYDSVVEINGRKVEVSAFASGQQGVFQVDNGQLSRFDGSNGTITQLGDGAGFGVDALGYNRQNDLLYGIATGVGVDDRGKPVSAGDLVLYDALGAVYRAGATGALAGGGGFDSSGNLWIFDKGLDRITKVDVDNFNAFGDPVVQHFDLPAGLFPKILGDVAYNAAEDLWYSVIAPSEAGANGLLLRLDLKNLEIGGYPEITSLEINRTMTSKGFADGMPRGAVSAVFLDRDGSLYFSTGPADHAGTTPDQGMIYQVHADWNGGAAFIRSHAPTDAADYDDGATDPQSADLFALRDAYAPVYVQNVLVQMQGGGDDILRGGAGDDELYGGPGDDRIMGGTGKDALSGGEGADRLFGGAGRDRITGEGGEDKIRGGSGKDHLFGGAGKDKLTGDDGDDELQGGAGADKLFGGAGADRIEGGQGSDNLWGGGYTGDSDRDVFVFPAASGRDYIHDFDVARDRIDLSAFWIDWSELREHLLDQSWAIVIELYAFPGGSSGDRIILPDVDLADLGKDNFIL